MQRRFADEGLRHHRAGQLGLANACYVKALAIKPDDPNALYFLGVLRHQEGHSSEAADLIAKALRIKPDDPIAYNNLGVVLQGLSRLEEALDAYDRAVSLNPAYAETLNNRGNALLGLARPHDALASYDRALAVRPSYAEALSNRGNALFQLLRFAEALASYDRALSVRPDYAEAHNNRGSALLALNQARNALESFNRALALNPPYPEALYNRGNAFVELKRYQEAIASYDRALAIRPEYAKALNNRGNALKDQGQLDEAVLSYQLALAVKPDYADAYSNMLFTQQYMDRITNAELAASAFQYGESFEVSRASQAFLNDRTPKRRLRIGYVSADFYFHPVGFFLANVLESHNRTFVEVFCYSNSVKNDDMTDRLRAAADRWRSIAGLSDADAASMIIRDHIDILVDLSGHTAYNRLPIFARRAAPVQASWLGYPGTTGLRAIDYLLMDESAVRHDEERWYTEAIVRLPYGRFCYSAPGYAPLPVDPPSLERDFVTFGSFNNIAKVSPRVVKLWTAILNAVPKSRLLLKWNSLDDETTRLRFRKAFVSAGVPESRLKFKGYSSHVELMSQYGQIDVALDPLPFSGALTTCEALWMGVPVVTLPGDRSASRQILGSFDLLGLNDCVAHSPDDYVHRAVALAADPSRLASLRRALRTRMMASPLCNGALFTPALERAFEEMWRRWCCGRPPAPFDVEPRPGVVATPCAPFDEKSSPPLRGDVSTNCSSHRSQSTAELSRLDIGV